MTTMSLAVMKKALPEPDRAFFPILPLDRQQDQPHYQRAKPRGGALV